MVPAVLAALAPSLGDRTCTIMSERQLIWMAGFMAGN
jgi:hypothetical protein